MPSQKVLDWLLEPTQPGIRYRTLTQLLDRSEGDPDVRRSREQVLRLGWGADLLAERSPGGWWGSPSSLYRPKYVSTNWTMMVLSDLGATRATPKIRASCELWMKGFAAKGGGLGGNSGGTPHHCLAGNLARSLIRMGYVDDPRIRKTLEWMVATADPKGGWSCWGSGRNLDSWEGLSALAAYPRSKRTAGMQRAVEAGAEFFLERELHIQGEKYPPWFRFHYPVHYYYDLLVGLDLMTSLGYRDDPRLKFALATLHKKRRKDGRWNLDAVHPDVEGAMAEWYRKHPPTPFGLEVPGKPSKMVTLTALTILHRTGT